MQSARPKTYWVYILSSRSRVLYIGMTGDLPRRMWEHRAKARPGFTSRYNVEQLVHRECTSDAASATARERQLKGWTRARKIALIESSNPDWPDLWPTLLGE